MPESGKDILGNLSDTARIGCDSYVSQGGTEYPYAKPLTLTLAALDTAAIGLYRTRDSIDKGSLKKFAVTASLGSILTLNLVTLIGSMITFYLRYLVVRNSRIQDYARLISKDELNESDIVRESNVARNVNIHNKEESKDEYEELPEKPLGSVPMSVDKSILKNNLSNDMRADLNYDMIFLVRFYSQGIYTGKVYDLDLKINLPAEQIEFVRRIFSNMSLFFKDYGPYLKQPDSLDNVEHLTEFESFIGENNHLREVTKEDYNKILITSTGVKEKLDQLSNLKLEVYFAFCYLVNYKGKKKDLNGRMILNQEVSKSLKKPCFKFYIDIDTSSGKSYWNDMTILDSHLDGFSNVIRDRFVRFYHENDRSTWLNYIEPLYEFLICKIELKIKEFFNSRYFGALHRENPMITDCSKFEALPYDEVIDRKKVRSIKEDREQKNDDQSVAQHAKKKVKGADQVERPLSKIMWKRIGNEWTVDSNSKEKRTVFIKKKKKNDDQLVAQQISQKKVRGWDQVDQTSFNKPFCSGIEAERAVLIDISFGRKIDSTHCIIQYQHALLLKALLDYSVDYLQGKSNEDFTYGGYNDRFCPYVDYSSAKRKELSNLNKKYLDTYVSEIRTGRVKYKSNEYPFLVRLLGKSDLSEVGNRRLHYPAEWNNGLRVTLEESKYLRTQILGAIEVVKTISLHRYVRIERDTKKLLCLLNNIPYSVKSLIGFSIQAQVDGFQGIDFDNVLNLYNLNLFLSVMDRKHQSHYDILMRRLDVLDINNRLIVRNFSSSLIFKEDRIFNTKSQYMNYFRLIQEYYPKVLDSFKIKMIDSKDYQSKQDTTDPVASKDASVHASFINYVERGGEVHRIGSLKKYELHPGTKENESNMDAVRNAKDQLLFNNVRIRTIESRYKDLNSKYQECYKDFKNNWIVNHPNDIEFQEFMQLMDLTKNDLSDIKHYRNLIDKIELPTDDPVEINAMRRFELMAFQLKEDIEMLSHYEHQMVDIMLD